MWEKSATIKSKVIPLNMKDVDTDMIIPAEFLTSISREGFGENLFKRLRESDPNFPFNLDKYRGAEILVADSNFGCGSSREHAVWALLGAGVKVIIGKSFADIFSSNSQKNGLLLVRLPTDAVDEILQKGESGDFKVEVNLTDQTVKLCDNGKVMSFDYDPFGKHCLLNNVDELDYIRSYQSDISSYWKRREAEESVVNTKQA